MLPGIVDRITQIHYNDYCCTVIVPFLFIFDYDKQRHVAYDRDLVVMPTSVVDRDSFLSSYLPLEILDEDIKISTCIFYKEVVLIKRDVEFNKKVMNHNYDVRSKYPDSLYPTLRYKEAVEFDGKLYVTGNIKGINASFQTRGTLITTLYDWYQVTYTREVNRYAK